MKKFLLLIILLLVAALMSVTRPDKQAHKAAMMEAVNELIDDEAQERGFGNNGVTRLGKKVVSKTIEAVLSSKLKVDDYFLFNTTHVKLGDETKVLSVGMFGKVFTFDKEMLRDALEESAREKAEAKEAKSEAKNAEKALRKAERAAKKEAKRKAKEAKKEQKRREKEAKKAGK
jgi:hypothetical protein